MAEVIQVVAMNNSCYVMYKSQASLCHKMLERLATEKMPKIQKVAA